MKKLLTRATVLLLATLLVLPLGSAAAEDGKKKTYSQQNNLSHVICVSAIG